MFPTSTSPFPRLCLAQQGLRPGLCTASAKSFSARMGARSHFVSLLVEFDPVAGLNWCLGRGRVGQDLGEVLEAFPG